MSDNPAANQAQPDSPQHSLRTCRHEPMCPSAAGVDRDAAHVVAAHPEQGWSLLCNGVVVFEDFGELLPNGTSIAARTSDLCWSTSPHRKSA